MTKSPRSFKIAIFVSQPDVQVARSMLKSIEANREEIISRFGEEHYQRLHASIESRIEEGGSGKTWEEIQSELFTDDLTGAEIRKLASEILELLESEPDYYSSDPEESSRTKAELTRIARNQGQQT